MGQMRAPFPGATAFILYVHILTETLPGFFCLTLSIFCCFFSPFPRGREERARREAEERQRQKLQAAENKARQLEATLRRKESAVLRLQVPIAWQPQGREMEMG